MRKNPIVLGIVNAVFPGLGYVLLGKRVVFGWLLIAGSVAAGILAVIEPAFAPTSMFVSTDAFGRILESIWYIFFILAYGYDAYDLARVKQSEESSSVLTPVESDTIVES